MPCTRRQGVRGVGPALLQRRHHLMTQIVAIELATGVAGVLDPIEPATPGFGFQFASPDLQQGALDRKATLLTPRRHGGKARNACAPECGQQQRLGLVITVLGQPQHITGVQAFDEGVVARLARRRLQALAGGTVHPCPDDLEGYPLLRAQPATVALEVIRRRLQAMVHVDRPQSARPLPAGPCRQRQQHAGVEPTGQRDPQRPLRRHPVEGPLDSRFKGGRRRHVGDS